MAAIYGDRGSIRVIENGQVPRLIACTSWSANEDASVNKRFYAGERYPDTTKGIMGWRGRLVYDVVNAEIDFLIQRINDAEAAGVNVPQIVLALVESYQDRDRQAGQPAATLHTFSGVTLIYDEHSGAGKTDLLQKSISFESSQKRVEAL